MEKISIQVETTKDNNLKIVMLKGPWKEEAPLEYVESLPTFFRDDEKDFYLLGINRKRVVFSIYLQEGFLLGREMYEDVIRNLRECCRALRMATKRLGER